jgi:dihydrofolate reductase
MPAATISSTRPSLPAPLSFITAYGLVGMTQITLDLTMSLDGFVAGPNASLTDPLGENGMLLHDWIFPLKSFREQHGQEGGEENADDALVARSLSRIGAGVMGRKMWSGGEGPWADDPNPAGWWGDEPPFHTPVFVVTHHARETMTYANGTEFHFVTGGVESAVAQARDAAGEKDVRIGGGASIATQCLTAGLLDRIDLHIAPILLGGGVKLFDGVDLTRLELIETHASPNVTHVSYRPI